MDCCLSKIWPLILFFFFAGDIKAVKNLYFHSFSENTPALCFFMASEIILGTLSIVFVSSPVVTSVSKNIDLQILTLRKKAHIRDRICPNTDRHTWSVRYYPEVFKHA